MQKASQVLRDLSLNLVFPIIRIIDWMK